jgi:hypothetical protein
MAALNFPTTGLVAGVTEYSANGTTYLWDGVKWIGRTAGGAAGTSSLQNNGHTVQVDASGNLVLPAFSMPNTVGTTGQVLKWPASGSTLAWANDNASGGAGTIWTNDANGCLRAELSSTGFEAYTSASHLYLQDGGEWHVGSNQNSTSIGNDQFSNLHTLSLRSGDETYITTNLRENGNYQWQFGNTGTLTLPEGGAITSPNYGFSFNKNSGKTGAPELGTDVTFATESLDSDILDGEVYMGSGYGEFRSIFNKGDQINSGLVYAGVEGFNYVQYGDVNFAGMVSQTPNIDSMYSVKLNDQGQIVLGFTQNGQTQQSNDWSVAVGSLTTDYTVNGLFANTSVTAIATGEWSWKFDNTGNLTLPTHGNINFANGVNILSTVTGGVNGTANRVQFAHAGSIFEEADAEPGRYNIVVDAEKDVVFYTNEEEYRFKFTSTGNLQLPRGGSIGNQDTSVDIALNGGSTNPYWYNLFGDTGASYHANAAINGSVVHDAGGNVYVLGSAIRTNSNNSDNLFLKYSPEGRLLWRRTWTDNNGEPCGSYNASLRYIAADVELGTQDTILWASQVPFNNISYVGTMDTDGNMVDQFGNVKLPTRLDNFAVTDLEWITAAGQDTIAYVTGQVHTPGPNLHFPTILGINLGTATVAGSAMIAPAGIDPTVGIGSGSVPWANMYKALTVIPGSGSLLVPTVGTYYDGSFSHAILTVASNGTPVTFGIGAANLPEDNILGEDLCCDTNGNVYVIVNNISSSYSVLVKANGANLAAHTSAWQLVLGTPHSGPGDNFYASAVAYDNGFVYVLGEYYDAGANDTDAMLIKIGANNGNIVWTRRIHSAGDDGVIFGSPGWESSSGISVYDDHVAINYYTTDRTPVSNGGPASNTVTLQYPLDGGLLGGFGDFLITDFDPGHGSANYAITTLTTSLNTPTITSGFASLQATTVTVGTGWTNTQWDMLINRQVYDPQTWRFNYDGSFDTKEIAHEGEVKITARTAPAIQEPTPSTWAFQNNDGLRFPDGSVQYGAYVETEMALDGGFAGSAYNIIPRPTSADGGGSSSRHGSSDPVYDGSSGENYVLDGGGA